LADEAPQGGSERWREMMAAAQSGDAGQYRQLLTELLPFVRRLIGAQVFDPSAVEDVVQNTLLSIHRARHTYRPERPFTPWLRAVARNAVIDFLRERGRRRARELPVGEIADWADPVAPSEPGEAQLSPRLRAALERLPGRQREAVELVQIEGLSVVEAAARAGVSVAALKVRAHRGYRALRRLIEGDES